MKNRLLISLWIVLVMLTASCSSSKVATNYYLLTNKVHQAEVLATPLLNSNTQKYQLDVNLPDYLQKPYLVMQLGENKMHYSMFHLWAEPLNKGVSNALLFDLNTIHSSQLFVVSGADNPVGNTAKVLVTIDYFHITDRSSVIFSGQFKLQNGTNNSYHRFAFEQKLTADGYSPAITQMRVLITKLSQQIAASI